MYRVVLDLRNLMLPASKMGEANVGRSFRVRTAGVPAVEIIWKQN
jgi:hypothetical protein